VIRNWKGSRIKVVQESGRDGRETTGMAELAVILTCVLAVADAAVHARKCVSQAWCEEISNTSQPRYYSGNTALLLLPDTLCIQSSRNTLAHSTLRPTLPYTPYCCNSRTPTPTPTYSLSLLSIFPTHTHTHTYARTHARAFSLTHSQFAYREKKPDLSAPPQFAHRFRCDSGSPLVPRWKMN
jgi:hypothetical protein